MQDSVPAHTFANQTDNNAYLDQTEFKSNAHETWCVILFSTS